MAVDNNLFLDLEGLRYFWSQIKNLFVQKDGDKVLSDNNFSDEDKQKLDDIAAYELPVASDNTLGGIKVGTGLEINNSGVLKTNFSTIENKPATLAGYGITDATAKSEFTNHEKRYLLEIDEIPDTTQTITFLQNGNVDTIVHRGQNSTIRTDSFTFSGNTISEARVLSTGERLTIVTNTETLVTTTTYTGV